VRAQRSGDVTGRASRLKRWLGAIGGIRVPAALGLLAFAAACSPAPAPTFGSGLSQVPASSSVHQQERAMFERLNRDRAKQGLGALRFDERLSEVARHHSADMRDHHFFEHHSPRTGGVDNRLDAAGYAFLNARENLSEAPDIERSQDGLLNSPPHYANIMSTDVTHVGIGIVPGGVVDTRNLTVTQVFARPSENEAPERATRRTLDRLDQERRERGHGPSKRSAQLTQLAQKHVAELDAETSSGSVERASQNIVEALKGPEGGSLMISAQVVPGSEQVAFPEALLEAKAVHVGLAMRRVQGEHGRPALQLLLLARADAH
jgi:uncharacterized protein YkwD